MNNYYDNTFDPFLKLLGPKKRSKRASIKINSDQLRIPRKVSTMNVKSKDEFSPVTKRKIDKLIKQSGIQMGLGLEKLSPSKSHNVKAKPPSLADYKEENTFSAPKLPGVNENESSPGSDISFGEVDEHFKNIN